MRSRLKATLFLCYLLIFQTLAQEDPFGNTIGNANGYIDELLEGLRHSDSFVSQVDPLNVPDFSLDDFQGTNCVIRGLSSLYRHGDCTILYDEDTANVSVQLAVKNVVIKTRYAAKALFFWINGNVVAEVGTLAARLDLSVDSGKGRLEEFKVMELRDYKINKVTGLSFMLNWLLKIIANSIATKSRSKIIHALETAATDGISDLLKKYEVPI